jgi:hypothetical protein
MSPFEQFCAALPPKEATRTDQAKAFLWFLLRESQTSQAELRAICDLFDRAGLPKAHTTRLREAFARDREVHRGSKRDTYRLTPPAMAKYEQRYGALFKSAEEIEVKVRVDVGRTPFLSENEVGSAFHMAQVYVVLHCYENSARRLIEQVLSSKFGPDWWDQAASAEMRRSVESRQASEAKARWLTPRGVGPLYYADWGDLVKLMRKFEGEFLPYIKDIKFAELRMEELERLRNIVAHNGSLPSERDFERVLISFSDWCSQVA